MSDSRAADTNQTAEIEGGGRDTLRGAAILLVIGVILGVAYNFLGMMSRPPHGLAWKPVTEQAVTLESLQQSTGATPSDAPAPALSSDLPVVPDVPGPIELGLPSLKKLWDAGTVLVIDARDADVYAAGHITGAINVPYGEVLATRAKARGVDPAGRPIVVYCSGVGCQSSLELADILVEAGRKRVLVYRGGYPEWQAAGYPTTIGVAPGERK